jgi:protein phosphatase
MRFLPGQAQHIGARQSQQDSFGLARADDQEFISHGGYLAVVCDGMGGMERGDAASGMAVGAFMDAYRRKPPEESIPAALERSVHESNLQVLALAQSLGLVEGMGTTLVAAVLTETALYYVSVGDSAIFHVRSGQIQMVNRPHVFANVLEEAVARGEITVQAALMHPERESLTSFIGATALEEIDRNLEPWPIQPGDTILLASDGMFKTLEPEEIAGCLRGYAPAWPEALVGTTLSKQREHQDNVTVVSVTAEPESSEASPWTEHMGAPPLSKTEILPVLPVPEPVKISEPLTSGSWTTTAPEEPAKEQPPPVPAPTAAPNRGTLWLAVGLFVLAAWGAAWFWYFWRG